MISSPCDEPCGASDGGDQEPCVGRCDGCLPVFCEAAAATEPGKGTLDDPAAGNDDEARCTIGSLDDLDRRPIHALHGDFQLLTSVSTVSEQMSKRGKALFRVGDDVWRAIPVLNISGMRDRAQHIALCISEYMALAALDLLARIIAARPAAFRGFHALAVDHTGCRPCRPTGQKARGHHQRLVDDVEYAAVAQPVEIVLDRREGRKVFRQHRPLATRRRDILDRVPYLAHPPFARSADLVRSWHEGLDQRPFLVRTIACIAQVPPVILFPSDFSPGHLILRSLRKPQRITSR